MTRKPPQAILFDMDGVLVESYEVWFHLLNQAATDWGTKAITREQFHDSWGQGVQADIEKFFHGRTVAEVEAYYQMHFRDHAEHLTINPDGEGLFRHIRNQGIGIAVITNTPAPLAREILTLAALSPDALVGGTDVPEAKPAPDMVLLACRTLNTGPGDVIVVGDSRYDKEAAAAAGVRFFGLGIEGDQTLQRLRDLADWIPSPR